MKTKTVFYSFALLCMASILFTLSCKKEVVPSKDMILNPIFAQYGLPNYCGSIPVITATNWGKMKLAGDGTFDYNSVPSNIAGVFVSVNRIKSNGDKELFANNDQLKVVNGKMVISVPLNDKFTLTFDYSSDCRTCFYNTGLGNVPLHELWDNRSTAASYTSVGDTINIPLNLISNTSAIKCVN